MPTNPSNNLPLFTYGTLMVPEVLEHVIGIELEQNFASLLNYQRYFVRSKVYPGIVIEKNAEVSGILYYGITNPNWEKLDFFEGDDYERIVVEVILENLKKQAANMYLFKKSLQSRLTSRIWKPQSIDATRFKNVSSNSFDESYLNPI